MPAAAASLREERARTMPSAFRGMGKNPATPLKAFRRGLALHLLIVVKYTRTKRHIKSFVAFPAIQTVAEAPEAGMGLRRRGARKNGERLERFRLGCSVFNGRVFAALRGACEGACGRHQ